MVQIDYYFTVLSPFTYLAGTKLETLAARRGAAIEYKPINVMEVFSQTGGTPPKDRHWSRQEYRLQELRRIAKRVGMPINEKPAHWPTDPLPASTALIAAQEAGFSIGLAAHGLMRAVWAEEKNIAEPEVVAETLAANGVAMSAIEDKLDTAKATFEANTLQAVEIGVFGSPFYVVAHNGHRELFWGQDRLDYLDAHLGEIAA